ncbi:hypothetical protein HMPREF9073_03112 [Capnocytophaga sp. oral taxon 326 str. F0382]|nr:hypothetical protein HMPREF9073_03112 [Capnocytophaga sp. oral taxon 326 str. F0382]
MFYAVNNVFKFATNVQLIFKRRKFYIEKSKNKIPLIKAKFLRLEKKITQIFVRK